MPDAYKRYLSNVFREAFDLFASPVVLEFRTDANPYDRRRALRKTTSRPETVDRPTTKGKSGGKAKAKTRVKANSKNKAKSEIKIRNRDAARTSTPKPGSSRSGKDNRRGPRVKAASGRANPNKRR